MGLPFLSVPCGKGMLGTDTVGLEISGVEAEANQERADVWFMGCEIFWAGMIQAEGGCDEVLYSLQENEERAAKMLQ